MDSAAWRRWADCGAVGVFRARPAGRFEAVEMADVSFAMEEAVAKKARHRKRGLKAKGETSASRTLDAIKQRRQEREEKKDTRTEVEKVHAREQAKIDAAAAAAASAVLRSATSRNRALPGLMMMTNEPDENKPPSHDKNGRVKKRKKKKEPVSGLLLALREKKEEENKLALGDKRWCLKCKGAFEGDICPNACPAFMYRDDIPQ
eukprot:COSAG02_NODE_154_length_33067_cov_38.282092_25_plen_205_part_00